MKDSGFTIIEVAVMLAIITAISAIVLISFTGLHESAAINRGARELALGIRRAQNMSFAIAQVDTQAGPVIPPAIGVRVAVDSPIYFLFADIVQDNRYSDAVENNRADAKISNSESAFEGRITVESLTAYDALMVPRSVPVAHVMFLAPEATVLLTDASGNSVGDVLEIGLVSSSGATHARVVVRTSGQVSIQRSPAP